MDKIGNEEIRWRVNMQQAVQIAHTNIRSGDRHTSRRWHQQLPIVRRLRGRPRNRCMGRRYRNRTMSTLMIPMIVVSNWVNNRRMTVYIHSEPMAEEFD